MIYHETRNFPDAERDGLAKELRFASMLLLRTITRQSTKSQKEFLASLDETIEIQLDILLLLKLAFRMGFIDQRVYQTLEEDLKGLEKLVNSMKEMHGMEVSTESIYSALQTPEKPDTAKKKDTGKASAASKQDNVPEMQHKKSPRSRRGHSKKNRQQNKTPDTKETATETEPAKKKVEAPKIAQEHFEGTPLYEDDIPVLENHKPEPKESGDVSKIENGDKHEPVSDDKKSATKSKRGRWSLKRSTRRSTSRDKSSDDESGKK